jgi:hypothetical protein
MIMVFILPDWPCFGPDAEDCPDIKRRRAQKTISSPRVPKEDTRETVQEGEEMSRKIRFAIASLIIFSLTAGSLSAFPLGHPTMPEDREAGALTLFVGWVASLFSWSPPHSEKPSQSKKDVASQLDPNGGPH